MKNNNVKETTTGHQPVVIRNKEEMTMKLRAILTQIDLGGLIPLGVMAVLMVFVAI